MNSPAAENPANEDLVYAGFWIRFASTMIDTALILMVTIPLLLSVYGWQYFDPTVYGGTAGTADIVINYVLPAIAVVLFWKARQATPGKMLLDMRIVDAETGGPPSTQALLIRYVGYLVASIPLCLGFAWVGWDPRKQGWHDKMAGTVVVRPTRHGVKLACLESRRPGGG